MLDSFISLVSTAIVAPRFGQGAKQPIDKPAEECQGKWIWIADAAPVVNSYIRTRKTFRLHAKPVGATLKICASSLYKLFVNGAYVGKGPVRSGRGYCYYDTFDITNLLHKGDNVIAALVHHVGEHTYSAPAGKPGLLCKAEVESEKESVYIGSDETWKVQRAAEWLGDGARINHRLGFQEIYDCASAAGGWTEVKFKEKGWENAVAVGVPPDPLFGELVARQIPQLREQTILPKAIVTIGNTAEAPRDMPVSDMPDRMAATEITNLRAGKVRDEKTLLTGEGTAHINTPRGDRGVAIVFDFGREVFGNVEVGIAGSGSGCIDLGYSEMLINDHVCPNAESAKCSDRVLLKKGVLAWQSFGPRAFRYLQAEFRRCSKPVALQYVRVNQTTYPVEYTASFSCNDRLLNEIWAAGAYTAELCLQDTFIDCPWREQAQWWSEARLLSRTAYYTFGDTALLAQALRQFAAAQDRDGAIFGLNPAGVKMLAPDLSILWVYSILDYYAFSDDAELVSELYPAVEELMAWFSRFVNDDGLLADVPGYLQIDHADLEREGEVASLNCLYFQGLRVAGMLAAISGKFDEAENYISVAQRVKVAINKFLYMPKHGLYAECRKNGELVEKFSRQTNILAALFDVTDQYQKAGIMRQMDGKALPELTTPYFGSFYLETLYLLDRHDDALAYMRRMWGEMIKSGATTLWEDVKTRECLCHGSAVGPARDLIAEYLGIKPVAGSHRFVVAPHTGDLRWAKGFVATNSGPLNVEWKTLRNGLELIVGVPEGVRVDVYPPGPIGSAITLDGNNLPMRVASLAEGSHTIRLTNPKPLKPIDYESAPAPLVPQVQVLENDFKLGRRRIELEPRRKTKRTDKTGKPHAAETDSAEAVKAPAIDLLPKSGIADAEQDHKEPVHAADAAEQVEPKDQIDSEPTKKDSDKKHRKRPRGGRGRGRTRAETPANPSADEAQPPTPEPVPESDTTEKAPVGEAVAPKPKRHTRGSRGRGKSRTETPSETPADEAQPPAPEPAPELETVEKAPVEEAVAPKPKRHTRGSRGRGKSRAETPGEAPADAQTPQESSEPQQAAAPDPEPESASQETESKPKKKRRTYTRRKKNDDHENEQKDS
ncbi:MAG: hypothetical protein GX139_07175 [Armatimonadetes bacterium]|nr:hypothetical protein [Armatimonadota bacterium]